MSAEYSFRIALVLALTLAEPIFYCVQAASSGVRISEVLEWLALRIAGPSLKP